MPVSGMPLHNLWCTVQFFMYINVRDNSCPSKSVFLLADKFLTLNDNLALKEGNLKQRSLSADRQIDLLD